jgi:hypothetical protein
MEKGETTFDLPTLEAIRDNALENLSKLPEEYKRLRNAPSYPVELSPGLARMMSELTKELRQAEGLG